MYLQLSQGVEKTMAFQHNTIRQNDEPNRRRNKAIIVSQLFSWHTITSECFTGAGS